MRIKRLFDACVAVVTLTVLSPLFVLIAVAIKLDSRGPVFFVQERIGLDSRTFRMCKFRTMVEGAEHFGPKVSPSDDPRITRVGSFLRKRFLDELPQFFNVLRGDMSLVGPRPETAEYVALYTQEEMRVLTMKPGMAGPSTLSYAREPELLVGASDPDLFYVNHVLRERVRLDLQYLEEQCLRYDVAVLVRTLKQVLWSTG